VNCNVVYHFALDDAFILVSKHKTTWVGTLHVVYRCTYGTSYHIYIYSGVIELTGLWDVARFPFPASFGSLFAFHFLDHVEEKEKQK